MVGLFYLYILLVVGLFISGILLIIINSVNKKPLKLGITLLISSVVLVIIGAGACAIMISGL